MKLLPAQLDRACGVMIGVAVGDALGAPYEFGSAPLGADGPQMIGGGLGSFSPGEWTDDTAMSWCVLDVAARGADLRSPSALNDITRNFRAWYDGGPSDIGIQTRSVLSMAGPQASADDAMTAAQRLHDQTGRTAGNGSLMRTAPVALAHLHSAEACAEAAMAVSALTHRDPRAGEACVLWSLAIRHAVLHAEFDVRSGLEHLDSDAAQFWAERISEAEHHSPSDFKPNGWVVTALQAAWAAIVQTPIPEGSQACLHYGDAISTAVGIGDDTDTVAAIAGGLLGARWGASGIPAAWRRMSHGYPGISGERLVEMAHLAAAKGPNVYGWPGASKIDYTTLTYVNRTLERHPFDAGIWLGDASELDELPEDVTAVVSLSLVGRDQVPSTVEHVQFRLIDTVAREENPNLEFVLVDAVRTIERLRSQGHTVFVHCVSTQSRTPAVAIAYAMSKGADYEDAWEEVIGILPHAYPNDTFREVLGELDFDRWR